MSVRKHIPFFGTLAVRASRMNLNIESNRFFLFGLATLVVVCVLVFNVVYFSTYYGIAEINYINSLLLVPFVLLIFAFGMLIEQNKQKEKTKKIDRFDLTTKEKEVTQMILDKKKNQEIADLMFVELSTVKTHINNIYRKVGAKDRKDILSRFE